MSIQCATATYKTRETMNQVKPKLLTVSLLETDTQSIILNILFGNIARYMISAQNSACVIRHLPPLAQGLAI